MAIQRLHVTSAQQGMSAQVRPCRVQHAFLDKQILTQTQQLHATHAPRVSTHLLRQQRVIHALLGRPILIPTQAQSVLDVQLAHTPAAIL